MKFRVQKLPVVGDTRAVRKFAWIPRRIDSDLVVWFEFYELQQEFKTVPIYSALFGHGTRTGWIDVKREALHYFPA